MPTPQSYHMERVVTSSLHYNNHRGQYSVWNWESKVHSPSAQSSPGNLQVGQVPSNWTRQMPHTSSSGIFQCQVATAFHSLIATFIVGWDSGESRKVNERESIGQHRLSLLSASYHMSTLRTSTHAAITRNSTPLIALPCSSASSYSWLVWLAFGYFPESLLPRYVNWSFKKLLSSPPWLSLPDPLLLLVSSAPTCRSPQGSILSAMSLFLRI